LFFQVYWSRAGRKKRKRAGLLPSGGRKKEGARMPDWGAPKRKRKRKRRGVRQSFSPRKKGGGKTPASTYTGENEGPPFFRGEKKGNTPPTLGGHRRWKKGGKVHSQRRKKKGPVFRDLSVQHKEKEKKEKRKGSRPSAKKKRGKKGEASGFDVLLDGGIAKKKGGKK